MDPFALQNISGKHAAAQYSSVESHTRASLALFNKAIPISVESKWLQNREIGMALQGSKNGLRRLHVTAGARPQQQGCTASLVSARALLHSIVKDL